MNLGKLFFGVRNEVLINVSSEDANKQVFVFNILGYMLLLLSLSCVGAGIIYGLIIFNNWGVAIFTGVFLGFICFILLQLLLFLSMQTRYRKIKDQLSNMETLYDKYKGLDFKGLSDEEAVEMVTNMKMTLSKDSVKSEPSPFHFSQIIVSAMIISLVLLISFIVANGFEVLMFRSSINKSFNEIKSSEQIQNLAKDFKISKNTTHLDQKLDAIWTLSMLKEQKGKEFKVVNCYSLLMTIEIMSIGLSKTKIIIDLLFAVIFLIPYLLVKKSDEFGSGAFLKEATIDGIGTSFLMFLLSSRKIQKIENKIKTEFDYKKALGIK